MVRSGEFREDLYFRINVFPITVPPLRERSEDILPLANHFLQAVRGKLGRQCEGFDREAENLLLQYPWPGNVRELRNTVERAVILERERLVSCRSLLLDTSLAMPCGDHDGSVSAGVPAGIVPLEKLEEIMVRRALEATGGNQTRAAELLGVSRDQLRYRVKKLRTR
jgi:two-component system NtrC family response regulator